MRSELALVCDFNVAVIQVLEEDIFLDDRIALDVRAHMGFSSRRFFLNSFSLLVGS